MIIASLPFISDGQYSLMIVWSAVKKPILKVPTLALLSFLRLSVTTKLTTMSMYRRGPMLSSIGCCFLC